MDGVEFSKGHGTENDFVVLPDPDGALDLTPARVAALCDRRRGLGADGVLRVVRWAALGADGPEPEPGVEWFMDYRNADGSVAEMCGNGVRVFGAYLAHRGWAGASTFGIGTRAGVKGVVLNADGTVSVDMGAARLGAESVATVGGVDLAGVAVDVGNPHLACVTDLPVGELDLTRQPGFDRALFPRGVNVEFLSPLTGTDETVLRVHERGVGETRACGTGTVAAVVAALRHAGRPEGDVTVHVPGGTLRVTVADGTTVLHGPAELVAHGRLTNAWWERADAEMGGTKSGMWGVVVGA